MICVSGGPEMEGKRFHHTTQNGTQIKTYEMPLFGIFHLILWCHGGPQVTETTGSKTKGK